MDAAPLRVGLIGCGFFAENHLAAWSSMDDVVLAAVCDLDLEKARSAAERHKAGAYYGDAAEMLARERLDFVDIATTMESHAQPGRARREPKTPDDRAEAARADLRGLRRDRRGNTRRWHSLHGA